MAALKRRVILLLLQRKNKYKKRMWVRRLFLERKSKGELNLLIKDMWLHDQVLFFTYFRMPPVVFEEILGWIAPVLNAM